MRILSTTLRGDDRGHLWFWCPGCNGPHMVRHMPGSHPRWNYWRWDGSVDRPTLEPSVLVRSGHYVPGQPRPPSCPTCLEADATNRESLCSVCHSYVRDGQIQFLDDCTHRLAGRTVSLPPWPPGWGEEGLGP